MSDDGALEAPQKTEFQNKLEEQAAAKGGLSYSYFAAPSATGAGGGAAPAPAPAPAPLSAEQAAALAAAKNQGGGGSAWNAAGTYEERDVSAWARRRVEELLEAGVTSACGAVKITSAAATGEAHVVFVRGKRRAAFELGVSMGWESAANAEIRGTAKTREEVTGDDIDDEDDVELAVSLDAAIGGSGVRDGGDAAAAAEAQRAAGAGLRAVLCDKLRQLRQEMRDGKAGGGSVAATT